jgi:enamine deaminase RidA (YjgF/YER057c/UK114 family)
MEVDKDSIPKHDIVESAAYLLRETFEGSPEGMPSAYLDMGVGFFATLKGINATAVSKEFHGTTIAAQTEHAKFYLDRLCEFINGRTERVNWDDSWLIETVNDEEWDALRESVRRSYEDALRCLAGVEEWNEQRVGMAMGMIAHTAYHLGAIRQIAKMNSSKVTSNTL